MQVVSINQNHPKDVQEEEQKQSMLFVLDYIRTEVEAGNIKEFVACSIGGDGIAQIHVSAMDLPGSIGLFEIGKHLLIQQESFTE
jgi:hypothetical protein